MMHENPKYKDFRAPADFSEQVMQKVRCEPLPKASLGRRLSQWGETLQGTRRGRCFVVVCQFLAGVLNISAFYMLWIGG